MLIHETRTLQSHHQRFYRSPLGSLGFKMQLPLRRILRKALQDVCQSARSAFEFVAEGGPAMSLPMQAFSETVCEASFLIPFQLEDADDEWDEITEQLQAIEWKVGL